MQNSLHRQPFYMPFESFRELKVWQKSVELTVDLYHVTRFFPADERFGIVAQLRRAAMSISNNIAEGHGRATRGEFRNALSIARRSANEVENCLVVSSRLEFGSQAEIQPLLARTNEIQRMLVSLRARLK